MSLYAHRMSSSIRAARIDPPIESVQPIISHNVRILMATKQSQQGDIGKLIGRTQSAISAKLLGKAEWSIDEILTLSKFGGRAWPVSRFLADPEAEPRLGQPTDAYIRPYIAASSPKADVSTRRNGHLTVVRPRRVPAAH